MKTAEIKKVYSVDSKGNEWVSEQLLRDDYNIVGKDTGYVIKSNAN